MNQQDPGALYPDHLAVLCRRAEQALVRGGFDHLVVPSGTLHYQVFDDRDYPYAVNPQFKAWLPLTRVPNSWIVFSPGKRPAVIFHQPFDYWHVVPAAGGWTISISTSSARRKRRWPCCRPTRRAARSSASRRARWAATCRTTRHRW